jgi:hypothetical protein
LIQFVFFSLESMKLQQMLDFPYPHMSCPMLSTRVFSRPCFHLLLESTCIFMQNSVIFPLYLSWIFIQKKDVFSPRKYAWKCIHEYVGFPLDERRWILLQEKLHLTLLVVAYSQRCWCGN